MARNSILPAIHGSPRDEVGLLPAPTDVRSHSRIEYLEGRIQEQEKTTHTLIDRAYKIKEDIIDNLNLTHGTWQEEKRARQLLQEHIRTITDVVHKLSKDIQHLEGSHSVKAGSSVDTQNAVKNLELHHVAGVTDLRGRVARCDASIARLSADIKTSNDTIQTLILQQEKQHAKFMEKLQTVETKLGDIASRVERSSANLDLKLRSVENGSSQQVSQLDTKTHAMMDEMHTLVKAYKASQHGEQAQLEGQIIKHVQQEFVARERAMDKFEQKVDRSLQDLHHQNDVKKHELENIMDHMETRGQATEKKLVESINKQQKLDISQLKHECHEGFATIRETITNMNEVIEGKRKILEEQLKKEISAIRKLVVLV